MNKHWLTVGTKEETADALRRLADAIAQGPDHGGVTECIVSAIPGPAIRFEIKGFIRKNEQTWVEPA